MDIAEFKKIPILGILRGVACDRIEGLVNAASSSGLYAIEITMNTQDAGKLIKQACKTAGGRIAVGAGTVLDKKALKVALDAGASFIVTPVLIDDVTKYCVKNGIPIFPGAFSPQEIYMAWESGATMVKVFPAGMLGPRYFREIRGPFNDIELLACGGVTVDNLKDYFSNGAAAAAFGGSIFRKEWLDAKDFSSIAGAISAFIKAYKACQN